MSNEPQTIHDTAKLRDALRSPRWPKYLMDNRDVQEMFGKKRGNHLPDEGFELIHNGVTIKCDPKPITTRKSSKHRVHYFCACCKWIPLGRASQHLPACEATDATI